MEHYGTGPCFSGSHLTKLLKGFDASLFIVLPLQSHEYILHQNRIICKYLGHLRSESLS